MLDHPPQTVIEALNEYLDHCRAKQRKETTVNWYKRDLKPFVEFVGPNRRLENIDIYTILKYSLSIGTVTSKFQSHPYREVISGSLAAATRYNRLRALRTFLKWLAKLGFLPSGEILAKEIEFPNLGSDDPKEIQPSDFIVLRQTTNGDSIIDVRDRAIIDVLEDTGMRAGGIVNLKISDIDMLRNMMTVHEKGSKARKVVFGKTTKASLEAWFRLRPSVSNDAVFISVTTGKPLTYYGLTQAMKRRAKRANVEGRVNLHAFRHGFALNYLRNGGNFGSLSTLLGHRDPKLTRDVYARFADNELAERHQKLSPVDNLVIDDEVSAGDDPARDDPQTDTNSDDMLDEGNLSE